MLRIGDGLGWLEEQLRGLQAPRTAVLRAGSLLRLAHVHTSRIVCTVIHCPAARKCAPGPRTHAGVHRTLNMRRGAEAHDRASRPPRHPVLAQVGQDRVVRLPAVRAVSIGRLRRRAGLRPRGGTPQGALAHGRHATRCSPKWDRTAWFASQPSGLYPLAASGGVPGSARAAGPRRGLSAHGRHATRCSPKWDRTA
ncbi:hypothetical protein GCM10020000_51360 [Streptomyces olivoverticillatus]